MGPYRTLHYFTICIGSSDGHGGGHEVEVVSPRGGPPLNSTDGLSHQLERLKIENTRLKECAAEYVERLARLQGKGLTEWEWGRGVNLKLYDHNEFYMVNFYNRVGLSELVDFYADDGNSDFWAAMACRKQQGVLLQRVVEKIAEFDNCDKSETDRRVFIFQSLVDRCQELAKIPFFLQRFQLTDVRLEGFRALYNRCREFLRNVCSKLELLLSHSQFSVAGTHDGISADKLLRTAPEIFGSYFKDGVYRDWHVFRHRKTGRGGDAAGKQCGEELQTAGCIDQQLTSSQQEKKVEYCTAVLVACRQSQSQSQVRSK
jgi:hypothetical protein